MHGQLGPVEPIPNQGSSHRYGTHGVSKLPGVCVGLAHDPIVCMACRSDTGVFNVYQRGSHRECDGASLSLWARTRGSLAGVVGE